ncbi:MAG TPA: hypothetical protein PKE40_08550 [Arachnia sp.]|nr:hypothetical protein [Arachnia sp.]HMT86387.1 hypothetical protein [Arachnia sp.]
MRITRRSLLAGVALGATGCAGSPTIQAPTVSPTPDPVPVQEPWAVEATATAAALRSQVAAAPPSAWVVAALGLCDEQLALFAALDPFAEAPEPGFDVPPPPTGEAGTALPAAIEEARQRFAAQVAGAPGQPERLLLASASCAVAALADQTTLPEPGGMPRRFAEATLDDSLPVALSHVWALLQGLEIGLGRLPRKDPLRDHAAARLPEARTERNRLRDLIQGEAPRQPASLQMPTPMTTPDEIRAGWAALELGLLDGYGRLTAVDAAWLPSMQGQVPRIQALGGRLPHWPGWAG